MEVTADLSAGRTAWQRSAREKTAADTKRTLSTLDCRQSKTISREQANEFVLTVRCDAARLDVSDVSSLLLSYTRVAL